jgi:hypothetical protein
MEFEITYDEVIKSMKTSYDEGDYLFRNNLIKDYQDAIDDKMENNNLIPESHFDYDTYVGKLALISDLYFIVGRSTASSIMAECFTTEEVYKIYRMGSVRFINILYAKTIDCLFNDYYEVICRTIIDDNYIISYEDVNKMFDAFAMYLASNTKSILADNNPCEENIIYNTVAESTFEEIMDTVLFIHGVSIIAHAMNDPDNSIKLYYDDDSKDKKPPMIMDTDEVINRSFYKYSNTDIDKSKLN